jgi:hypothetical protein
MEYTASVEDVGYTRALGFAANSEAACSAAGAMDADGWMTPHVAEGLAVTLGIPVLAECCAAPVERCAPALHAPSRSTSIAAPADDGAATAASLIGTYLPLATPIKMRDAPGTRIGARLHE